MTLNNKSIAAKSMYIRIYFANILPGYVIFNKFLESNSKDVIVKSTGEIPLKSWRSKRDQKNNRNLWVFSRQHPCISQNPYFFPLILFVNFRIVHVSPSIHLRFKAKTKRSSIEDKANIYRTSIEHLSKTYRREHVATFLYSLPKVCQLRN